jgi:hypothetical protein
MKLLIVGSKGSIGSRYEAICRFLKIRHVGVDLNDPWPKDFTHALICTPTGMHTIPAVQAMKEGMEVMIEKPLSKDTKDIETLIRVRDENRVTAWMVNNYFFSKIPFSANYDTIKYSYFFSGKDGWEWDCIQLINMCKEFIFDGTRPVFNLTFDGTGVTLEDVQKSYMTMLLYWAGGKKAFLWDLEEGLNATQKVQKYIGDHSG